MPFQQFQLLLVLFFEQNQTGHYLEGHLGRFLLVGRRNHHPICWGLTLIGKIKIWVTRHVSHTPKHRHRVINTVIVIYNVVYSGAPFDQMVINKAATVAWLALYICHQKHFTIEGWCEWSHLHLFFVYNLSKWKPLLVDTATCNASCCYLDSDFIITVYFLTSEPLKLSNIHGNQFVRCIRRGRYPGELTLL